MDPTRIEIDLPIVVVTNSGYVQTDNFKNIADLIAPFFGSGAVLTLHIVAEDTGLRRGFCTFEVDKGGKYPHRCNYTLRQNGMCPREDEHEKERVRQLELSEAEESE
jgi:hypothetical protein